MKRNTVKMIALALFVLALALGVAREAQAQDAKNPYPTSMAPLDQYLMGRDAEIALARSAAPPSVSQDATVMVLGRHGYETAVEGKNGFVCNVDRSWMDQFENSPEFWNPKRRGPVCYNPQAARTLLPITLIRTNLALAGKSKAEMNEGMKAAIEKGELPALEPDGMAYMQSKQGFLNSRCGNCSPHLMFYVPPKDAHTWGAGAVGSGFPVLLAPHFNGAPEPVTEFIVPVSEWSDGTSTDTDDHAHAQDKPVLGHWVSAWGAAPHGALQFFGIPPAPTYENQTLRMIVRLTIGGKRLRMRFSNEFGASALKIGAAHIALLKQGSKIVPDTDRVLTFGGQKTIAIPPGAPALSDPVDLNVPAFAEVAVSIFLPEKTPAATSHSFGAHETYIGGPGDLTGQTETPNATVSHSWFWLSGVELWAAKDTAAIVALGDSITEGFGAKFGEYHGWTDQLAKRLAGAKAVVNEGTGGNRLLHDGMGVNALARFDRDVLSQPGVTDLILLEGAADVLMPHMTPPKGMDQSKIKYPDPAEDVTSSDLIAGMREMIDRAHEHGIRIFGATLLPFEGVILPGVANCYTEKGEATRQAVNQWIRTGGAFDGVIDFDAAVRDSAHPTRFRQDYQSGDYLHPNDAGYKAMADAIDLSLLRNSRLQ